MFEDYRQIDCLGRGSFGAAYLVARKSDGLKLVLKVNSQNGLSDQEKLEIVNEAMILKHADHPNIIKFYDFFEDSMQQDKLCIVMEYADDGDLQQKIKKMPKDQFFPEE